MQSQINNVQTFKVVAEIFGVTQEELASHKYGDHVVSSKTWKSQLGIKGRTRPEQKKAAQAWVLNTYNKKVSQDESDAICIGASIVKGKEKKKNDFNWD